MSRTSAASASVGFQIRTRGCNEPPSLTGKVLDVKLLRVSHHSSTMVVLRVRVRTGALRTGGRTLHYPTPTLPLPLPLSTVHWTQWDWGQSLHSPTPTLTLFTEGRSGTAPGWSPTHPALGIGTATSGRRDGERFGKSRSYSLQCVCKLKLKIPEGTGARGSQNIAGARARNNVKHKWRRYRAEL